MEFHQADIKRFLADSIPSRFQNMSPAEFSHVMAEVFKADGYTVEEISTSEENSGDLIARKEGVSLIIKALRHPVEYKTGLQEIQKAAAARTYFDTDQSWIITTSSFTEQARKSAESLDIELWDWDELNQAISELFFDGKTHYEYLEGNPSQSFPAQQATDLKLKAKWQPEEGIGAEWYNLDLVVSNQSDRHVYIHLDLPALIDPNKNQVLADQWAENEFIAGIIYAGASIRTNALFKASRLGERPPGGKVMLTCHERTQPPSTYHLSAKLKGEACYLVTYCYGRGSEEYKLMIRFRDGTLSRSFLGRIFVKAYYFISPLLIKTAGYFPLTSFILKRLTIKTVQHIKNNYE